MRMRKTRTLENEEDKDNDKNEEDKDDNENEEDNDDDKKEGEKANKEGNNKEDPLIKECYNGSLFKK